MTGKHEGSPLTIRGHPRIRRFSKKTTLEQQPKRIKEKMMSIPTQVCSKQKNKDPEAWWAWMLKGQEREYHPGRANRSEANW